jgi:hypothetical protein
VKRVLVLYPGLAGQRARRLAPFRWRLRLAGVQLLLADTQVGPEDRGVFADVVALPPSERASEAWDVLARTLERGRVDAIVAQSEPALLLGARAAEVFGLRGPRVDAALATVDKHRTRELLAAAGVPQPRAALVRSAGEVRRFGDEVGWPVVLKAVASSRQRLVTLVACADDVEPTVARMRAGLPHADDVRRLVAFARLHGVALDCDPTRAFLVESFERGTPVECDGVLSGTRLHTLGVCEQVPSREHDFFIDGYLLPGRLPAAAAREVEDTTRAAVRALGLSDTGVSVELRAGEAGPRVIEVNGRLPWDDAFEELVRAATGTFPSVLALRVALGRRVRVRRKRHAALLYRSCPEGGLVERVPTEAECAALERGGPATAFRFAREGTRALPVEHRDARPHLFGLLTTDRRSPDRALALARRLLAGVDLRTRAVPPAKGAATRPRERPARPAPGDLALHRDGRPDAGPVVRPGPVHARSPER